jgi:hypothetical protein
MEGTVRLAEVANDRYWHAASRQLARKPLTLTSTSFDTGVRSTPQGWARALLSSSRAYISHNLVGIEDVCSESHSRALFLTQGRREGPCAQGRAASTTVNARGISTVEHDNWGLRQPTSGTHVPIRTLCCDAWKKESSRTLNDGVVSIKYLTILNGSKRLTGRQLQR